MTISDAGTLRRIARNAGAQIGADIVGKLASTVLYVVMARAFGQHGFGIVTFAISLAVFVEIAGLGMDVAIIRDVARNRGEIGGLIWNSGAVKLALGAIVATAVIAFAALRGYSAMETLAIATMSVARVLELLARSVYSTLRGLEAMVPVAWAQVAQRISTTVIGVSVVLAGGGVAAAAGAYLCGTLVGFGVALRALRSRGVRPKRELSRRRANALAIDSLPLGLTTLFAAVLARIDAIILSLYATTAVVGLYGAAYALFEGTLFVSWALSVAIYPVLSRLTSSTAPTIGQAYELATKAALAVLLPIGVSFGLFGATLIRILYGQSYAGAANAIRLLGIAATLYGLYSVAAFTAAARDRQRSLTWTIGVAVLINVVLNVVLIPRLSLDGAAAAMAASQAILTLLMTIVVVRLVGRPSIRRIALGPVSAGVAMAVPSALVGTDVEGLLTGLVVYVGMLAAVDFHAFPGDLGRLREALRPARPLRPTSVPSVHGPPVRGPDFFVVGAPKSGTTSIDVYLRAHPQIFMARKELHYFASDLPWEQPDWNGYLSEFAQAQPGQRIGESSVGYMYSMCAAAAIARYSPEAQIIASLRNPVDMVISMHSFNRYQGDERIGDVEQALEASMSLHPRSAAVSGRNWLVAYRDLVRYREQLERYLEVFGADRLHVVLFDDLRDKPPEVYGGILAFLGVDPDFEPDFEIHNATFALRSDLINRMVRQPGPLLRSCARVAGPRFSRWTADRVLAMNTAEARNLAPPPETRVRMSNLLEDEVRQVADLLGRDLSHWLEPVSVR